MVEQSTVKKITKTFTKVADIAVKYYSIVSVMNNLNLTDREIQMLAHIAIKGTISTVSSKEEFIKNYDTTLPTVNNLISTLRKKGYITKVNKMLRLHPQLLFNFNSSSKFIFPIVCTLQKELTTK